MPADSTLLVRPRSSLGLKYIELTPGEGRAGLSAGSTIPVRQARPAPVELDELFDMFDDKTRVGSRNSLDGFGGGFAGRGQDINVAIEAFVPLLADLEPVARNLVRPGHAAQPLLRLARADFRGGGAGGRGAGVAVREPRHLVHCLRVDCPAVPPGDDLGEPGERAGGHRRVPPPARRSSATTRPSSASCDPGVAVLPHGAPILADAFEIGTEVLPKTIQMNEDLADVFEALADFSNDPPVRQGVNQLTRARQLAAAHAARSSPRSRPPATTRRSSCATWRACSPRATRTATASASSWSRRPPTRSPSSSARTTRAAPPTPPRTAPAATTTCMSNPYPNTAAPGQTQECEGGNERYTVGQTLIGNQPGSQGLDHGREAMRRGRGSRFTPFQAGLIALIVILVGTYLGASKDIPFTKPYQLKAVFENAPPIHKGQAVRIAGVDVGKVSAVEPVGGDSPAVVGDDEARGRGAPDPQGRPDQGAAAAVLRGQPVLRHPAGHARGGHGRRRRHDSGVADLGAGAARPGARNL